MIPGPPPVITEKPAFTRSLASSSAFL